MMMWLVGLSGGSDEGVGNLSGSGTATVRFQHCVDCEDYLISPFVDTSGSIRIGPWPEVS